MACIAHSLLRCTLVLYCFFGDCMLLYVDSSVPFLFHVLTQSCVLQDTFLDAGHVKESFPANQVEVVNGTGAAGDPKRPFRVAFPPAPAQPDPTPKVSKLKFYATTAVTTLDLIP